MRFIVKLLLLTLITHSFEYINAMTSEFAIIINDLFVSNTTYLYGDVNSFIKAHDRKIDIIRQNSRDTIKMKRRHNFILRLHDNCDDRCHSRLLHDFNSIEPLNNYQPINYRVSLVSLTFNQLESLIKGESYSNIIIEFTPLIGSMKFHPKVQEIIYGTHKEAQCYSYVIKSSSLTLDEIKSFSDKLITLSNGRFQFDSTALNTNIPIYLTIRMTGICSSHIDKEVLESIALYHEVIFIHQWFPTTAFNRWTRGLCQTGEYNNAPIYSYGNLTGSGQIVGVTDTGINMNNCYFNDPNNDFVYNSPNPIHRKVIYYGTSFGDSSDDFNEGHGTHVSGSVAGFSFYDYGDFKRYNGVAYNAKIAFLDIGSGANSTISTPNNLNNGFFQVLYNQGARVITNSWGSESDNSYNSQCESVDLFMWTYPEALVLYAAGNYGSKANTVRAPSVAKNVVCVGATLNDHKSWQAYSGNDANSYLSYNNLAYFSSRGPTKDGRMKPDVLAPGWFVTSASSVNSDSLYCAIKGLSGTSMATPTAAGIAALIREYFMTGYYPTGSRSTSNAFIPSGALIKAILVHSARAVDNSIQQSSNGDTIVTTLTSYPSNNQGYGLIRLDRVLNFGQSATNPISLFVVGAAYSTSSQYAELSSNSQTSYSFTTSSSTDQTIRITLAYTDYPGSVSTTNVIVNVLSLSLKNTATGATYSPYVTGQNVQVIDISSPSQSTRYTVTVSSSSLSYTQPFALVVTGELTLLADDFDTSSTITNPSAVSWLKSLRQARIRGTAVYYIVILAVVTFIVLFIARYVYLVVKRVDQTHNCAVKPKAQIVSPNAQSQSGPSRGQNSRVVHI